MKKMLLTILIFIFTFTAAGCGGNFAKSPRAQYNAIRNYAGIDKAIDFSSLNEIDIFQSVTMGNAIIRRANGGNIIQTAKFKAIYDNENTRTYYESQPLISIAEDGKANFLGQKEHTLFINNLFYPRSEIKYESYNDMLAKNPLSLDNLYRSAFYLPLDTMFSSFVGAKNGKFYVLKMEVDKNFLTAFFLHFEAFYPFLKLKYVDEDVYGYFNPNSVKNASLLLNVTENSIVEAKCEFLINGSGQIADITVSASTIISLNNVVVPDKW